MTRPGISVLIDAYNHERYVEQCVVSAMEQDFAASEYEIVVVDDGSTDGTAEVVKKFAPRVRLVRKSNGGQGSAFNAGAREAKGEAIALLDGDDWFAKGKLAAVAAALEREPDAAAVSHGHYEVQEPGGKMEICLPASEGMVHATTREEGARGTREHRSMHIGALTVRRKFLDSVLPIADELIFCADHPISRAAAAMGVYLIREPLFYYRFHEENRFAGKAADAKKAMMYELSWREVERTLARMGVPAEAMATLVYEPWALSSRERMRNFGGSAREAMETEMRLHRAQHPRAGGLRRALACAPAAATFVMPARSYYEMKLWWRTRVWFRLLDMTRPVRHAVGLRAAAARHAETAGNQSERV